jgi:acyl dehydratase
MNQHRLKMADYPCVDLTVIAAAHWYYMSPICNQFETMTDINYKDQEALNALVSENFGQWSNKVLVDQAMINQYAQLSGDDMWMHVDVERCAKDSPFGGTIAHGFLILSLITRMSTGPSPISDITGFSHMMNYGSDKLRFLGAVPVNSEIVSRSRIKKIDVAENKTRVVMETHVHVEGSETPALIYELMFVFL